MQPIPTFVSPSAYRESGPGFGRKKRLPLIVAGALAVPLSLNAAPPQVDAVINSGGTGGMVIPKINNTRTEFVITPGNPFVYGYNGTKTHNNTIMLDGGGWEIKQDQGCGDHRFTRIENSTGDQVIAGAAHHIIIDHREIPEADPACYDKLTS